MSKSLSFKQCYRSVGIFILSPMLLLAQDVRNDNLNALLEVYETYTQQDALHENQQVRLNTKLLTTSAKINNLKKELKSSPSVFKQYKLDSLMKEAQDLANQVVQFNKNHIELQGQIKSTQTKLVEKLDMLLSADEIKVRDRSLGLEERKNAYVVMMQHLEQRDKFLPRTNQLENKTIPYSRLNRMVGQMDQRDVLQILKRDIKTELNTLSNQLSALQKQAFMRSELETFLDEEAFFSETGFVRSSLNGKTASPKDDKLSKTASATNSGNGNTSDSAPAVASGAVNAAPTPLAANTTGATGNVAVSPTNTVTGAVVAVNPVGNVASISAAKPNDTSTTSTLSSTLSKQDVSSPAMERALPTVTSTLQADTHTASAALMKTSTDTSPGLPIATQKVEGRDHLGMASQELSRTGARKKSVSGLGVGSSLEQKSKSIQDRVDYLKTFLHELEADSTPSK